MGRPARGEAAILVLAAYPSRIWKKEWKARVSEDLRRTEQDELTGILMGEGTEEEVKLVRERERGRKELTGDPDEGGGGRNRSVSQSGNGERRRGNLRTDHQDEIISRLLGHLYSHLSIKSSRDIGVAEPV